MSCSELLRNNYDRLQVDCTRYQSLPPEGKDVISGWYKRAWEMRDCQGKDVFEAFFYLWIAVNSWAVCVTDCDVDAGCVDALRRDSQLNKGFADLVNQHESPFAQSLEKFAAFWPIFDVRSLSRRGIDTYSRIDKDREKIVDDYLQKLEGTFAPPCGKKRERSVPFAPQCSKRHREEKQSIPKDWPHTLSALYQVRCNFFHGSKALSSEMDQHIVASAYTTLLHFFQQGYYIASYTR
jgi:hypothetical protein